MSYILEALKKSESERNQGRVPDLGQQMRMIHRKRRRGIPAVVWLAIALMINAIVLAILFWPGVGLWHDDTASAPASVRESGDRVRVVQEPPANEAAVPPAVAGQSGIPAEEPGREADTVTPAPEITAATGGADDADLVVLDTLNEAPTVIIPTVRPPGAEGADDGYTPTPWDGRVPHLVEMPMAFQRQVPDLVFNSHVYSARPSARSVMINNRYLRMGDTFGPLRIERITKEGVELSMDGQRFRVGVVRDWSSPR